MSFVLSRNDAPEPSKYALKDCVVQIIGRGSLRDCNDPRISREHASVTTKGETLILRALHLKPCFYRRRFSNTMSKLTLGESVELYHGDFFGLLPDTNWYELIFIKKDGEDDKDKAEAQNKNIQPDQNETKNDDQSPPTKRPHTPDQDPGAKKIKTEPESPMKEGTVSTSDKAVGETEKNTKESSNVESSQPPIQDEEHEPKNSSINQGEAMVVVETDKEHDYVINNAESLDLHETVNEAGDENKQDQSPDMATDSSNNDVNVSKDTTSDSLGLNNPTESDTDAHSSGDEVAVKLEPGSPTKDKADPLELSGEPKPEKAESSGRNDPQSSDTDVPSSGSEMDVKKEPGVADDVKKEAEKPDVAWPGTSKDQPEQAGPSNDGAAPAPPNAPPRERCLYAANCYSSTDDNSRRRRVTYNQLETLWEFLSSHKEIATGYNKSAQAREYSRRLWMSIVEALNSHGEGAVKDWKGWSSYWVDYKAKLKKRAARSGDGPLDVALLSDIEQKFMGLLGDSFGLPSIQVDPLPTISNNTVSLASESPIVQVEEVPPSPIERPLKGPEVLYTPLVLHRKLPQESPKEAQEVLQPQHSTNDIVEPPETQPERRRRRRRRQSQMSQESARRALVENSRERLQLETRNAHNLERLLHTMERIANILERKNPEHKAQFSHPGDADYGDAEKAQCPYGGNCHRTDPRHWLTHEHPRGTHPPQRGRNGIRVVQRRGQFFYINAHAVHFHDNHYAVEDEDGQRVDYDYEF